MQRVHDEGAVVGAHRDEPLSVAQRELRDGHASGLVERLLEERVGLRRGLLRFEVIRRLEVEIARQLLVLDEPRDVDGLARAQRKLLEVVVVELDVVALLVLVPADDVAPRDLVVALDAPALVLDAAPVLGTEQVERDLALAFGREIEADGNGDHPEAHHAAPDGPRHLPHLAGRISPVVCLGSFPRGYAARV